MLNEIDKKVIYELGKNSRLSYKEISKNIKSKKEIVSYHLNQLIEKRIITKFVPVFSLSKLGIFSNKIYLKLHGLNKETEQKFYKYLLNNKDIIWIAKCFGKWDLLLGIYTKNIIEFSKIKYEILMKFEKLIKEYDLTYIEDALVFNRDYLINNPLQYRKQFQFGGKVEDIELKKDEKKIIRLIKNDARYKILDVAERLKVDPRTILTKIKSLEKREILQGFTIFLDLNKLKMQLHKICIYLNNYNKTNIEKLENFLKLNPSTIHFIKSIGSWEYEIEIESGDMNEVYNYISELKNKFPDLIKQTDLVTITDEIKLEFFPENL